MPAFKFQAVRVQKMFNSVLASPWWGNQFSRYHLGAVTMTPRHPSTAIYPRVHPIPLPPYHHDSDPCNPRSHPCIPYWPTTTTSCLSRPTSCPPVLLR
ncbi:hypothetical protein BC827DRAFT_1193292 [Russula dissimulans]|nr:hypothetical protein BC827DRAFT_1193292 [Russula dissimulans]